MNEISETKWLRVLMRCGVRASTAMPWASIFAKYVQSSAFSLGMREIDDFTGQVLHETQMLERLEENLNYRAQRLCEVWPARFPSLASASYYQFNPEGLAEKVYGGRMGNTAPGDGYRYAGKGIPMVTGKDNYALLQGLTGLPLVDQPRLLAQPDTAMRCAILWWEKKVPDSAIDTCDRVTRAVQGAELGLADRAELTQRAGQELAS